MSQRNLANLNNNVMSKLLEKGIIFEKERILNDVIPNELSYYHNKRLFWIHDLEFYDSTYNCIGVEPNNLIKKENVNFNDALKILFIKIVELTNVQSGGIGLINFDDKMSKFITNETNEEIKYSIKWFFNDLNMHIRKGCEKAYVTLNFGLSTSINGRRISCLLLEAFEEGDIYGNPFIFPNLVFKIKKGVNSSENDKNYDLFLKSCSTTAKCMIPTYLNCDSKLNINIDPKELGIMGCRTRVANNLYNNKKTSINRGNIACVTINLVQLAIKSEHNYNLFLSNIKETLDKGRKLLKHRLYRLSKYGDFSYIKNNNLYLNSTSKKNIDMLKNGTLAFGFIGLWESIGILENIDSIDLKFLKNNHNIGYNIIKYMREIIDSYIKKDNLNYSLLASASEGVSGVFFDNDSCNYNLNKYLINQGYYTNSFHIPVNIKLNIYDKIKLESKFHSLCNGGSITYIELRESPKQNYLAIKDIVQFACEQDCNYIGINYPLDICNICKYKGNIEVNCPICNSDNILRLRRVSGYLSDTDKFSKGKSQELKNRVSHDTMI
ncbi:DUF3029 family protein [Anaerosalibacter bizertensis]|uniref:anaerobic ribonucleoside-triphosphate reductase n=1 Tax=Anaerosalibacter bizertensis TaxID=932217 RepID=UPI001C0ED563|nr:anaerobic ribonucleoside-triphosphate reductase [Anaerosalibacter bizertensis]MBU5294775.1 DUF3029 family protein [Anaerosalibacter bizertensis]